MSSNDYVDKSSELSSNYRDLLYRGKNAIKSNNHEMADYFIFLALISPNIDLSSFLQCLSARSFIYYKQKNIKMLLFLSKKTYKQQSKIMELDDNFTLSDVIKIYYRTGTVLINNSPPILSYYILSLAKEILNKKGDAIIKKDDLESFNLSYDFARDTFIKEINKHQALHESIIDQTNKDFLKEEKEKLYEKISTLSENNNFDCNGSDVEINEECYLVSNKWLKKYNEYLIKMLENKDSYEDYMSFIKKAFDSKDQLNQFNQKNVNCEDSLYMSTINNFWIENYKECWVDKDRRYTSSYLKKQLQIEEYSIINKTYWKQIVDSYRTTNEIQRIKLFNDEIEVNLLSFKVLILDQKLVNKQNLIPKWIQLSKRDTIADMINSINNCLEPDVLDENINIYQVDIEKYTKGQRKQYIYEILISYLLSSNNSIKLKGIKIDNESHTVDKLKDHSLIIIEINDSNEPFINLISPFAEEQCNSCGSSSGLIQCSKCKISLINKCYYCNNECQNKDNNHKNYHVTLIPYFTTKWSLSYLQSISLNSKLNQFDNTTSHGLVGFRNLGNTCFLNSALQCLSHCEELTKFFLMKYHEHCLNKRNETNGEVAISYYELINSIWISDKKVYSPNDFKGIFSHFVKQFAGYSQHDSQEALTFILDKLHDDLNKIYIKPYIEMQTEKIDCNDKEASTKWWRDYKRREDSIIIDLFHGQFKNKVSCIHCKHVSIKFDPFVFLSLPIPSNKTHQFEFKFFPLLKDTHNVIKSHKKKKNSINTTKDSSNDHNQLICNTYSITLEKPTIDMFEKVILENNKDIAESDLELDFLLLRPNKEYYRKISSNQDMNELINDLLNGCELVIYEKKDNIKNVYCYPCDLILENKYYIIPNINVKYLSYPIAIPMSSDETVNDLDSYIHKRLNCIIINRSDTKLHDDANDENQSLKEDKNQAFNLLIYNTKKIQDNGGIFNLFNKFFYSDNDEICNFCGLKCNYCSFNRRFSQNETFGYIFPKSNQKEAFILYVQLDSYDKTKSIYNNEPIPLVIKKPSITTLNQQITLYDCLDLFSSEEHLDDDNKWYCSNCKEHQEAIKKLEIYTSPLYLIIQLKRFKGKSGYSFSYGKKNRIVVDCPLESLDLSKYIVDSMGKNAIYDLFAISQHYGQLSGGHYTAVCKNDGKWYDFNDSSVNEIDADNVMDEAAYILFYKKK